MKIRFILSVLLGFWAITLSAESKRVIEDVDSVLNIPYNIMVEDLFGSSRLLHSTIEQVQGGENSDNLALGKLHAKLGIVYHLMNKQEESLAQYLEAITALQIAGEKGEEGAVYAQLGYAIKERDIKKSLSYMRKGISLQQEANHVGLSASLDNYGVLMELVGESDSALFYYESSLRLKENNGDKHGVPYSLQKIATSKAQAGRYVEALQNIHLALDRAMELGDSVLIAECWTYYGDIYKLKGDYKDAESSFLKALSISKTHRIEYLIKYIYDELPEVYANNGNPRKAYDFLKEGSTLRDSMLNVERVRAIAELETRFETNQKEQKIVLLEKEVRLKELRIKLNKRIIILGVIGGLLSLMLMFMVRNQHILQYEAKLAKQQEIMHKDRLKGVIVGEERERARMARELHDGLGQVLSAARMYISSMESTARGVQIEKVKNSYGLIDRACLEVREISHALLPPRIAQGNIALALGDLIEMVNQSGTIAATLQLNNHSLKEVVNERAVAIYRIVQEMVNNTLKHSDAVNIQISITKREGLFCLRYMDDGTNFNRETFFDNNGIGWANISSRAELIGASIQIETTSGGGFSGTLVF